MTYCERCDQRVHKDDLVAISNGDHVCETCADDVMDYNSLFETEEETKQEEE